MTDRAASSKLPCSKAFQTSPLRNHRLTPPGHPLRKHNYLSMCTPVDELGAVKLTISGDKETGRFLPDPRINLPQVQPPGKVAKVIDEGGRIAGQHAMLSLVTKRDLYNYLIAMRLNDTQTTLYPA